MFDVGFSEILVILVVALIVIGPDRLPQVARTLGKTWGRLQRYVNQIKQDVNSSMELEELRNIERRVKAEADALENSISLAGSNIDRSVRQLEYELERAGHDAGHAVNPGTPTHK